MDEHASETNADSREPLSFEQIVSWERPSDPRISPDGQNIAFCVRPVSNDEEHPKGSIWLVPFEDGEPRRLTSSAGLDQSPRWSPDGSRIAFISDRAERGKTSVYVMRVDGGEAERCFDQQGDVGGLAWSLDGRFLSVLFTEPETEEEKKRKEERDDVRVWDTDYKYRRLWIIDVQTGEASVISPEARQVHYYSWSPDSERLALNTTATPRIDDIFHETDVSIISRTGGDATPVFTPTGITADLLWSADSRMLAYRGPAGRVINEDYVYAVDLESGGVRCLTPDYHGTVDHQTTDRTGQLNIVSFEGLNALVYTLDWDGNLSRLVPDGFDGKITPPFTLSSDGNRAAFVREDAAHAPNVWSHTRNDISQSDLIQLTHYNTDLESAALGSDEIVTWTSDPGVEIQGLLFKPFGYVEGEHYPLLA
ncbi:MAG: S9 family peptidase, partial [Nitrolancea sp.]